MAGEDGEDRSGMLLGRQTPVTLEYTPQLLFAIPRAVGRDRLGLSEPPPFYGVDLWHAYEMSWLDTDGKPVMRVGRFSIPASSPNIIESKSFKLYLNSLNNKQFKTDCAAKALIVDDTSFVAGASIGLELVPVDDASLLGSSLKGECLDSLPVMPWAGQPQAEQLEVQSGKVTEEMLYTHMLRSLCPVTGQPDWASVWLHYGGKAIDRNSLLQYIIAFREHQAFHEQCVERIFHDIFKRCRPEFLHVQAFYTRRGGMDINPFRSTDPNAKPLSRLSRQ